MLVNLFLFNFYTFDLKLKKSKDKLCYYIFCLSTLSQSILSLIIIINRRAYYWSTQFKISFHFTL